MSFSQTFYGENIEARAIKDGGGNGDDGASLYAADVIADA